jgi:hypothetical protein
MTVDKADLTSKIHDELVLLLVTNGAPASQDEGFQRLAQAMADPIADLLLHKMTVTVTVGGATYTCSVS